MGEGEEGGDGVGREEEERITYTASGGDGHM